MRFLITNSVPLNGGDEALLRATIASLRTRWPDCQVAVLCSKADLCRRHLPDLELAPDLEFAAGTQQRRQVSDLYRSADVVLASAGGYLHDFYPIEARLRALEVVLALGKPVILLPQSIGPFWKAESLRRVPEVLNRVSRICVRDHASTQHLLDCGVHPSRILETADVAFLWRRLAPQLLRPKDGPIRTIGLCFRVWPIDDEAAARATIAKAERLCRRLLADPGVNLIFLSTCQGVPDYIDDSALALDIVKRLPPEFQERCRVDRNRYTPEERIQAFGQCDAYIGMRLHSCILAMLGGTLAMGLGYEQKTQEIFRQLGLERYQVSFEEDGDAWLACAERFLNDVAKIRATLPETLDRQCRRAGLYLDAVENALPRHASATRNGALRTQTSSEWTHLVKSYAVPHLRLRQVAALARQLQPAEILDIGCATGQLRQLCPGVAYVGCDFVAPSAPVDFPFYQCDFNRQALPADLQELQLIVCSGILEYIEDLPRFLSQLRARLKSDGHLLATYFNMNHISRIWALLRGRSFHVRPDWRGLYSPPEVGKLIEDAGFRILRRVPMNHALRSAVGIVETVDVPLTLPVGRPWSTLLAHQFIFMARCNPAAASSPTEIVGAVVPPQHSFILVDDQQWADMNFGERRVIPFLEKNGEYWGPPPDDATAVEELQRLRNAGVGFIVFAEPAFWWFEHYTEFHRHLRTHFRRVLDNSRLVVFDLRRSSDVEP